MRVAIITPYHSETRAQLLRCRDSVAAQSHPVTHIWVSDGIPDAYLMSQYPDNHISLPKAHADYGDTPRLIGTLSAYQQGFDAVCWLDADNWLEPDHVEQLVRIADREVASVVTATRNLMRRDGSLLAVCGESDGVHFSDTNCYLVMRDAIPEMAMMWGFKPQYMGVVGDRFVWQHVLDKDLRRSHCAKPTVNYTTCIAAHYLAHGEEPPPEARVIMQRTPHSQPVSVPYAEIKNL